MVVALFPFHRVAVRRPTADMNFRYHCSRSKEIETRIEIKRDVPGLSQATEMRSRAEERDRSATSFPDLASALGLDGENLLAPALQSTELLCCQPRRKLGHIPSSPHYAGSLGTMRVEIERDPCTYLARLKILARSNRLGMTSTLQSLDWHLVYKTSCFLGTLE